MQHRTASLRNRLVLCVAAASVAALTALTAACSKADHNASDAPAPASAANSGPPVAAPATAASDHPAGASQ